jgi:NADH-quinone oxidoreductase subunit E
MKPVIAPDKDQPKSFAFSKANEKAIKDIIARYPKGRQKSAIMPLLDLAQRQMAQQVKQGGG